MKQGSIILKKQRRFTKPKDNFEKIKKQMDLSKRYQEGANVTQNKRGEITIHTTETEIINQYYEQLYANKVEIWMNYIKKKSEQNSKQ